MTGTSRSIRLFYGWWITAAALGLTFVSAGTGFYSFGVLMRPLMNEFGWSRGIASLAQSIYLLTAAATGGLFAGKLIERYGIRKVVLAGAVVGGAAWFLLSLTPNLSYFYTFYFLVGIGLGCAGMVPAALVTSNWFTKRRGTAMGIASIGMGLGAMILVPLVGAIAEKYGWRHAYIFMGSVVYAIDIPLALLVLKTSPKEMGLLPDGGKHSEMGAEARPKSYSAQTMPSSNRPGQVGSAMWLRSLPLWLLCISFAVAQISELAILTHEVPFITDVGISATAAAVAFGFTGGIGGVGKIVFGWLTDKISTRYVTMLCFFLQLLGVLILMRTQTLAIVWLFVVAFGFSMGGMVTLLPLAVGDLWGANFYTIYGFAYFVVQGAAAIGPAFAGFIFDATGSYAMVFLILTREVRGLVEGREPVAGALLVYLDSRVPGL